MSLADLHQLRVNLRVSGRTSTFNQERVLSVHHWTDNLFSFTTTRDPTFRFRSGEFTMIGLEVDGKPLLRAYNLASAHYEDRLEFLSIKVPDGPLSSRLQCLTSGHLSERGFTVDEVSGGDDATAATAVSSYDAIILDLGLPDANGLELLARLSRAASKWTPVIVVSARDGVEDRVRTLDAGADDYLVKPFDLIELDARLRALLRRLDTDRKRAERCH